MTHEVCSWSNILRYRVLSMTSYGVIEFEVRCCLKKSGEGYGCHNLCKSKVGQDVCVNLAKLVFAIVMLVRGERRILSIVFVHGDRYLGNKFTVSG